MAKRTRKPKPGIYPGVPFADYQAWPYVNNSSLGPALRSGAHYKLAQEREQLPPSKEMILGSMVNCLVLQPELFGDQFVVQPDFTQQLQWKYRKPEASDEYKGRLKAWTKDQKGKTIVSAEDRAAADLIATEVFQALPEGNPQPEVSIVSDCPETKLRLKARLDVLFSGGILDIKTTREALHFEDEIERYGYHRQAAFYQDILAPHVNGDLVPVWLLAAETSPPYLVRCVRLDEDAIEDGRAEVMRALRRIARGRATGVWDGYPRVARWRLPARANVLDLTIHGVDFTVR